MNPVAKKKAVTPKTQKPKMTVALTRKRRGDAATPAIMPAAPVLSVNGIPSYVEDRKVYEEYLIYKQLKQEVAEFTSYPGLWLESPHDMLSGQTPLQMALASSGGKEIVLNLIGMIKAGMFS